MHLAENSIQNIVRLLLLWQHIVHGLPVWGNNKSQILN